jgi:hypothetical protein
VKLIIEAHHESWPLDKWVRVGGEDSIYEPGGYAAIAADELARESGKEWAFRINRYEG